MGENVARRWNAALAWIWPCLALALLFLILGVSCNPLRNRTIQRLPGVSALAPPVPPAYSTSILGLEMPQAVAVTANGERLYVAEGDGERSVKVIDLSSRSVIGALVPPATTPGQRKPISVAVAPEGVVYVVDRLRLAVDLYDVVGNWLGTLPDPNVPVGEWEPLGVGIRSDGEVYVTNTNPLHPAVAEYLPTGVFLRAYGVVGEGAPNLAFPAAVTSVEPYLLVTDSNHGRIAALNEDGQIVTTYGELAGPDKLALPRGILVDARSRCYIADATNHQIKVWDVSTTPAKYLFAFGEGGYGDGEFLYPNSIAADSQGRIYIADTGNNRVQLWTY